MLTEVCLLELRKYEKLVNDLLDCLEDRELYVSTCACFSTAVMAVMMS